MYYAYVYTPSSNSRRPRVYCSHILSLRQAENSLLLPGQRIIRCDQLRVLHRDRLGHHHCLLAPNQKARVWASAMFAIQ